MRHRCLVIENDPTDDARRLGEWLTTAGLALEVVRAHAGEALPAELDGWAALVVLGGEQHAYPGADGQPGAPWFGHVESLLRKAVRMRLPTLGVCLGAQLLALAHAGSVEPAVAGPEFGAQLIAKRDLAERDLLFAALPMLPDVITWHYDEVTELPLGAALLAASTNYPHQAFRVGECAWGLQFHIECDTAMVADWASGNDAALAEVGLTGEGVVATADAIMDDLFEVWQPVAYRFAQLARGELELPEPGVSNVAARAGRELPLLGS